MTQQPPPLTSIPSLHAFDSQTTTWKSYRDRIQFYFKANRITDTTEKKALFLWSVGDTTYHLLENLISPKSLPSEDTQFDELIRLLDAHFDDTKNIMTSTFDFYSCYQKDGQSFSEWKAELCAKLRHCGFTTSILKDKPQDRADRDMYVIGIKNPKIRQALLKEQDPDLATTEKIIQLGERLAEDLRHFVNPLHETNHSVAKIHTYQQKPHKQQQQQQQQQNNRFVKNDYKPCESCGSTKHLRSKCKYRNFTCNYCKRTGHLERVCRQKKEGKQTSTNHISTVYKLDCFNDEKQPTTYSPTISLQINGHKFIFELDTGTFNTIISMNDWCNIGSPTIHPSKLKLKCYNGITLDVKGECHVNVQYKEQNYNLSMLIVDGTHLPLLGLQWIYILQLDLNNIIHGQNSIQQSVHKIYNNSKLQIILNKYSNVLNHQLEHCTKIFIEIC